LRHVSRAGARGLGADAGAQGPAGRRHRDRGQADADRRAPVDRDDAPVQGLVGRRDRRGRGQDRGDGVMRARTFHGPRGAVLAGAAATLATPSIVRGQAAARVVVIGAGFGGATAAKYVKTWAPSTQVTVIEPAERFITCPYSNLVLGGLRDIASITHSYD